MADAREPNEGVYAILRWDGFHGLEASPETLFTVKKVVHSQEIAEAEVARLNGLVEGKNVRYWWQFTRLTQETSDDDDAA